VHETATPAIDRSGLLIGVAVGIPAAVGAGAVMAMFRSFFESANAALVLMLVVVAVAAVGGRTAGVVTALAAMASFDFFHTRPYLSMTIDSRDDVETTVLLLVAGIIAGTIGLAGRSARHRAGEARSEIRRIHRVAEAASSGRAPSEVLAVAQDELRELLTLRESRFEAMPYADDAVRPRLGRTGAIAPQAALRYTRRNDGRGGFELPAEGAEIPVLAHGEEIARFVLMPTPGTPTSLEARMAAVAIADQVGNVWTAAPAPPKKERP
jgi:hypothetical protein